MALDQQTLERWLEQWRSLLDNVERLCELRLLADGQEQDLSKLRLVLKEVISELRDGEAVVLLQNALMLLEVEDELAFKAVGAQIIYFNQVIAAPLLGRFEPPSPAELDRALGNAVILEGGVRRLIDKLPGWVGKLLAILADFPRLLAHDR